MATLSARSLDGDSREVHLTAVIPVGAPRILVPPSRGMTLKIRRAPPKAIKMQTRRTSLVTASATVVGAHSVGLLVGATVGVAVDCSLVQPFVGERWHHRCAAPRSPSPKQPQAVS